MSDTMHTDIDLYKIFSLIIIQSASTDFRNHNLFILKLIEERGYVFRPCVNRHLRSSKIYQKKNNPIYLTLTPN